MLDQAVDAASCCCCGFPGSTSTLVSMPAFAAPSSSLGSSFVSVRGLLQLTGPCGSEHQQSHPLRSVAGALLLDDGEDWIAPGGDWPGLGQGQPLQQAPGASGWLVLDERLTGRASGAGAGSAAVFRGRWYGREAAVKVLYAGEAHQDPARVTEMAVLSTTAHPNIVELFACATDMAAEEPAAAAPAGGGTTGLVAAWHDASARARPQLPRLRELLPGEVAAGGGPAVQWGGGAPVACDVLITEFCDRGSLADALAAGPDGPGAPLFAADGATVDLAAACGVLMDVACALDFLHAHQLVHGNVTAEAVLLKTDPDRPSGFTAKLAGFGRCRVLDEDGRPLRLRVLQGHDIIGAGAAGDDIIGPGAPANDVMRAGAPLAGPRPLPFGPSGAEALLQLAPEGPAEAKAAPTPASDARALGALMTDLLFFGLGPEAVAGAGTGAAGPVLRWASALAAICTTPAPGGAPSMGAVARALERMAKAAGRC